MRDEDIVPSSGFTASVMDAIMREANAPAPIPFPWKRALPGLGWCLVVAIAFLIMGPRPGNSPPPGPPPPDLSAVLGGLGWIAAAMVVSLLSVALSMRVARH
jgi:hypothetical protein